VSARRSGYLFEVFLVSFAALLLEISYTRVFSFKVSSYYTYLIIGFALLGLGSGGVFVALRPRLREAPLDGLLPRLGVAGALAVGLGYALVAAVEIDSFAPPTDPGPLSALVLVCLALFASFLAVGLFLAAVFARSPGAIHRLYFADLLGAGTGCAAAVPCMLWLTPPGCVLGAGAALALAGLRPALRGARPLAAAGALVAAVLAGLALFADRLPDPVVAPAKSLGRSGGNDLAFRRLFHRWHPVFRVDVLDSWKLPDRLILAHDGHIGSMLPRFDGDAAEWARAYERSNRALPFAVAPERPRVLVIGSAGGNEIRASLHFGASSVTAVELNPVTVSLLRERFADYTGRLAEHERVRLVNAEGRTFLMRDEARYDLIWFVAPDSYAAMNAATASSFVLVESYLYTREMIAEALGHLTPGGVLCMQFGEVNYDSKPNRTARYLATARAAFTDLGIEGFARHVLLATNAEYPWQLSTLILSKSPSARSRCGASPGRPPPPRTRWSDTPGGKEGTGRWRAG